jgi:glutamate synthase (NADPH/NADH) large chain
MIEKPTYLASPDEEKASCCLCLIANKDGKPSRQIIEQGRSILNNVVHRGAVGADGSTGDGAGAMVQIHYKLLSNDAALKGRGFSFERGDIGLGQFFLPQDEALREQAIAIIETQLRANGITNFAFRDVPTDPNVISETAKSSMPVMKQVVFARPDGTLKEAFEPLARDILFGIEKAVAASDNPEFKRKFYTPSLSTETVVYKGLLRSDQLIPFYRDLDNPDFESAFMLVHNRFSTNTVSQWKSAQPFRTLAHNGEINTIKGNVAKWLMERREVNGESFFIDPQYSDSARLDLAITSELMKGRGLDEAVLSLVAPAWRNNTHFTREVRDFFRHEAAQQDTYCGPAMLIMTNGQQIIGHTDSFGLRPASFVESEDQMVFSSEFGTVNLPKPSVERQLNVRAGGVFVYDFTTQQLRIDEEVLQDVASRRNYGELLAGRELTLPKAEVAATQNSFFTSHSDRMRAQGITSDETDTLILPVVQEGKIKLGAMGPQIPVAALSPFAHPLSDYLAQKFAEVSNPPLASSEEKPSMSLFTFLGANAKKIPDAKFIELSSPLLRPGQLEAIYGQKNIPFTPIDITFNPFEGEEGLAKALRSIGEAAVQSAKEGSQIIVLTDRFVGPDKARIDATLATAAIDYHLQKANLRMNTSIVVDTGQVMGPHQEAVLLAMGANAVHPYLAYDEAALKAKNRGVDPDKAKATIAEAWDTALLKVMAKMGIPDVIDYAQTGRQFEARGLKLEGEFGAYMGDIDSKWGGHGMREISQNLVATHSVALLKMGRGDLLKDTPLVDNTTQPGDYWYETQRLLVEQAKMTAGSEELTRLGTYVARHGGEPRMRSADTIAEYRAVEYANTKEETYLKAELRKAIEETKGREGDVKSAAVETVLSNMRRLMTPEYKHLSDTLRDEFTYSTSHIERTVNRAISEEKLPAYMEVRKEKRAENAWGHETAAEVKTTEGYRYSPKEIADHSISPAMQKHYDRMAARRSQTPNTFADLLDFAPTRQPLARNEVTSTEELLHTFNIAGMSDGAIQYKPHAALARVANNIGARSNSGEGGERQQRNPGGLDEDARSTIRQCASGRWGYTIDYMKGADEIEIKCAQGAKPGEGGELPGKKNTPQTARNRRATPGTDLVSPPPHHDMYSIEDLEQLIHDIGLFIKQEKAQGKKVAVKLVATEGIGTIAAGVVKAGADVVTIAGMTGGTGAANIESIHHAGMPVHQGVREAHQTLVSQGLRDKALIRQSGDINNPRDAALAYAMGADQIEVGTDALVRIGGCKLAQTCNTGCPVFLTTEGDKYDREDRVGEREFIAFMHQVGTEISNLGYKGPEDIRGKVHEFAELRDKSRLADVGIRGDFDFDRFLAEPQPPTIKGMAPEAIQYHKPEPKDNQIINELRPTLKPLQELFEDKNAWREAMESGNYPKININIDLCNCDRSFGSKLSGFLAEYFYDPKETLAEANALVTGKMPMPEDLITVRTRGEAGNSFGVFNHPGVTIIHEGSANCYVGKGMGGGTLALTPDRTHNDKYVPEDNAIMTNLALFGATGGKLYSWGGAGERFMLRNSGASAVVVGPIGDYAAEYMARGSLIAIGEVGANFGKNMTGGVAVIYDPDNKITKQEGAEVLCIRDFPTANRTRVRGREQDDLVNSELYQVIQDELAFFVKLTKNPKTGAECDVAKNILMNLDTEIENFKFIVPKSMGRDISQKQLDDIVSSFSGLPTTDMENQMMQMYGARDTVQRPMSM